MIFNVKVIWGNIHENMDQREEALISEYVQLAIKLFG